MKIRVYLDDHISFHYLNALINKTVIKYNKLFVFIYTVMLL